LYAASAAFSRALKMPAVIHSSLRRRMVVAEQESSAILL
jgi:hypothetical protein